MADAHLINLLPDTKQTVIKAQRRKHIMISVATAVIIVAIAVPIVLFTVKQSQNLYLSRTQKEIQSRTDELKATPDIVTMLTVKDHLNALPELYKQRLAVSKLLEYIPTITPAEVNFKNLTVDTTNNTINITGSSPSYFKVAQFYLSLQRAKVDAFNPEKVEPDPDKTGDFTNVVLQNVAGPSGIDVSYTISANFNPEIIQSLSVLPEQPGGPNVQNQ